MRELDFLDSPKTTAHISQIRGLVRDAMEIGTIAIVGSALLPQKCAAALQIAGANVAGFIEYEPKYWGQTVLGLPVMSPSEAANRLDSNTVIIVGIWSPGHSYVDSRNWMSTHGFKHILPVAAIFWLLSESIGPHYQLANPEVILNGRSKIRQVFAALSDEQSKLQFSRHLRWRVSLDADHIPHPDRHKMYFDPSLIQLPHDSAVADCGAFDGDSLRRFLYWHGENFGAYYAFEPDGVSFSRLCKYIESLKPELRKCIFAKQFALGQIEKTVEFSATGKSGSQATVGGATQIQCLRLDALFDSAHLDYLKLDIEGAEWDALRGAKKIISRDRPVIATAIYHRPDDIFELPLYIMSQTPGYRYFIRTHDIDGIDLVLYAIPENRLPSNVSFQQ